MWVIWEDNLVHVEPLVFFRLDVCMPFLAPKSVLLALVDAVRLRALFADTHLVSSLM